MIDQAAGYEHNPLIETIRSEYGTKSRTSKGVPTSSELLQSGIRPDTSRSDSTSDTSTIVSGGSEGTEGRIEGGSGTRERRDSRERRTNSKVDQSDGGIDGHLNPISRAFQQHKTDDGGVNEEKPSGLYTKPNIKEQRARETNASDSSSDQAQSKKNFFSWLRSDNHGKTRKEPKPRKPKGRPLTEKEIEELGPELVIFLKGVLPIGDEIIYATNKNHAKPYIFTALDDYEIGKIVEAWLRRAKKSPEIAVAARVAIESKNDIELLFILMPLFAQTYAFYKENGGFTLRGR